MSVAEAFDVNVPVGCTSMQLMGHVLIAHNSGVLYWPDEQTVAVADLHLEKGSSYARRGTFLPPYDSRSTLARLQKLVTELNPLRIIALGDSFHDKFGADRLVASDCDTLAQIQEKREWIWIAGNHDPLPPESLGGHACQEVSIGGLTFRHEPIVGAIGEIAGHLHPCSKVRGRARSVRRPCFIEDGNRVILPAFGALTGGLNIRDKAFSDLFAEPVQPKVHMIGEQQIYTMGIQDCVPDSRTRI